MFKGKDVYGLVIATGKDTKIRLKQNSVSQKSWYLQRRLNVITTVTLIFLLGFILLGTYGYLDNEPIGVEILQVLATYFLLFNGESHVTLASINTYHIGLIAQTLQFTLDAVRGIQVMYLA